MKIHIQAIRNLTDNLAKKNRKKYNLKKSPENTGRYYNEDIMFELARALFIDLNDSLNGIIDVPDNWRELIENKFSLKKIKSTLNSKIEKQRLNGKEKN